MTNTKFKQTEIGLIPEDWGEYRLGNKIELCYGKSLPEDKRLIGDISVFGSNGIIGNHNVALTKGPGIIIGRKGSVGEVIFSENDFWPIDTTYFVKLKFDENIKFWYYFLLTLKLNKMNSHSAVPGLNRDQVYDLVKRIPESEEQKAIAKILSDLDSKIELNQQMNKTLEEIGKTLFKRWFVDFEFPNEQGKPYKLSGGEMVFSEELNKEIPKGWVPGKFKHIGKILPGFAFKSEDFSNDGARLVKIRNINNNTVNLDNSGDYLSLEIYKNQEKYKLYTGDIIIAMTGAELGKVGIIPYTNDKLLLNQRVGKLVSNYNWFGYFILISDEFQYLMKGIASASSAQGNISNTDIEGYCQIIPKENILNGFERLMSKIYELYILNTAEIKELSDTRDILLPKLMSGKIRVIL